MFKQFERICITLRVSWKKAIVNCDSTKFATKKHAAMRRHEKLLPLETNQAGAICQKKKKFQKRFSPTDRFRPIKPRILAEKIKIIDSKWTHHLELTFSKRRENRKSMNKFSKVGSHRWIAFSSWRVVRGRVVIFFIISWNIPLDQWMLTNVKNA